MQEKTQEKQAQELHAQLGDRQVLLIELEELLPTDEQLLAIEERKEREKQEAVEALKQAIAGKDETAQAEFEAEAERTSMVGLKVLSEEEAAQAEEQSGLPALHQLRDASHNLLAPASHLIDSTLGSLRIRPPRHRPEPLPQSVARLNECLERCVRLQLLEQRRRLRQPFRVLRGIPR